VDLWPELRDELATYKPASAPGSGFVFATASGKPDTRGNIAKRLKRAIVRANVALEAEGLAPIAALLYERGEDPVYVMD
jgi:hypothetical protein